jgi:hypothetical protein
MSTLYWFEDVKSTCKTIMLVSNVIKINRSEGGTGGKGIECKCMIASGVQSVISFYPNPLV